ncbi:TPA: hypothetical protein RQJ35_004634, partial [Vibrio vulnificus]|nr:hypothetical protein [Vibrio vulnificus]
MIVIPVTNKKQALNVESLLEFAKVYLALLRLLRGFAAEAIGTTQVSLSVPHGDMGEGANLTVAAQAFGWRKIMRDDFC